VQPGICLKLFSSKTEQSLMKTISQPELVRIPLEEACLNILATGLTRKCKTFLSAAPQAPPDESVDAALAHLREIGAADAHDGVDSLTPLGRHLAQLPLDARLGKMLIYGALFKCVDPISTIAACLSASKSVFMTVIGGASEAKSMQSGFRHASSDFLTLVMVYEAFEEAYKAGTSRRFCQRHFLNYPTLLEVRNAKSSFLEMLCSIGFLDRARVGMAKVGRQWDHDQLRSSSYNANSGNEALLHSVVFAGVYPNLARLTSSPRGTRDSNKKPPQLEQRSQTLEIHNSSVNYKLRNAPTPWMAFDEKLATGGGGKRTTVSTTCFVDGMSILLFANALTIHHFERKAVADGWIEVGVAAHTAVTIRAVRAELDRMLESYFDRSPLGRPTSSSQTESSATTSTARPTVSSGTVDSIVKLLTHHQRREGLSADSAGRVFR
jgi:HrpA-like RNA helicase